MVGRVATIVNTFIYIYGTFLVDCMFACLEEEPCVVLIGHFFAPLFFCLILLHDGFCVPSDSDVQRKKYFGRTAEKPSVY